MKTTKKNNKKGFWMIKTELFNEDSEQTLQKELNEFLIEIETKNFIDIKYQHQETEHDSYFSAMVIYKEFLEVE